MKTLFFYSVAALLIAGSLVSCSKKSSTPEPADKAVKAADLQAYYITCIRTDNGKLGLSVIYFVTTDGTLNAVWDKAGSRRVQPVSVEDNRFIFDEENDGKYVFTFTLAKDAAGKLSLTDAAFKDDADPQSTLNRAIINKVSEAPSFEAENVDPQIFTYTKSSDGDGVYMYFETESRWRYDDKHGSTSLFSYYLVGNGAAWKSEDPASGGTSIGVSLPDFNGDGPAMLIQSTVAELEADKIHVAPKL